MRDLHCFVWELKTLRARRSRHNLRGSGRGATTEEEDLVITRSRQAPAEVMISLLSESEGGQRGHLSPGDLLTSVG